MNYPSVPQRPVPPEREQTNIWIVWAWLSFLVVVAGCVALVAPSDAPEERPNRLINPSPTIPVTPRVTR